MVRKNCDEELTQQRLFTPFHEPFRRQSRENFFARAGDWGYVPDARRVGVAARLEACVYLAQVMQEDEPAEPLYPDVMKYVHLRKAGEPLPDSFEPK
nr:hypothetical protein [Methylocystis sp. H62]